jgi:hypothetical protein
MMKKLLYLIAAATFGALLAVACSPDGTEPGGGDFDQTFLYSGSGLWSFNRDYGEGSHVMHHKFNSDGTGWERNITEDTPQQAFTWTLVGSRLAFIHKGEFGQEIPEDCTVTTLTATKLVYKTPSGLAIITCTKQ